MTYDEHFEHGEPGPLAGQGWYEALLDRHFKGVDPQQADRQHRLLRLRLDGLRATRREISVQEAWELLESSRAPLRFDEASLNPTFTYVDDSRRPAHQVWYLDGVTAYNQIAAALSMKPGGLALWRLGTEDPSVWEAFGRGRNADAARARGHRRIRARATTCSTRARARCCASPRRSSPACARSPSTVPTT